MLWTCRGSSSSGTAGGVSQSTHAPTRSTSASGHRAHYAHLQESTVSGTCRSVSLLRYVASGFFKSVHCDLLRESAPVLKTCRVLLESWLANSGLHNHTNGWHELLNRTELRNSDAHADVMDNWMAVQNANIPPPCYSSSSQFGLRAVDVTTLTKVSETRKPWRAGATNARDRKRKLY